MDLQTDDIDFITQQASYLNDIKKKLGAKGKYTLKAERDFNFLKEIVDTLNAFRIQNIAKKRSGSVGVHKNLYHKIISKGARLCFRENRELYLYDDSYFLVLDGEVKNLTEEQAVIEYIEPNIVVCQPSPEKLFPKKVHVIDMTWQPRYSLNIYKTGLIYFSVKYYFKKKKVDVTKVKGVVENGDERKNRVASKKKGAPRSTGSAI